MATAPSLCVQNCISTQNNIEFTNCNPSDAACLCISEDFLKLVAQCITAQCPSDSSKADTFFVSQCAVATASLLNPRQGPGESTPPADPATAGPAFSAPVPPSPTSSSFSAPSSPPALSASNSAASSQPTSGASPSSPQPSATASAPVTAQSHTVNKGAIAGGVVGGIFKDKGPVNHQADSRASWVDAGIPHPPAVYASPAIHEDQAHDRRAGPTLTLDRPMRSSVLAAQAAMWEKASSSSSPSVPAKELDTDVAAALWNHPHQAMANAGPSKPMSVNSDGGSSATGSGGTSYVSEAQVRAMAERLAMLEAQVRKDAAPPSAASAGRAASPAATHEPPPNYTAGH
ncbi:hypothetical protein GGX14DRAFT_484213 [Mycena pura]|uniref:CFEM domain-containing protein n=1 Tax=Mycena pura TaxID=153505 RepID=A0AAD6Y1A8_9AGAR|nr:hypothetical protein GGX14DRAFT_484213 [Mycena pura]